MAGPDGIIRYDYLSFYFFLLSSQKKFFNLFKREEKGIKLLLYMKKKTDVIFHFIRSKYFLAQGPIFQTLRAFRLLNRSYFIVWFWLSVINDRH